MTPSSAGMWRILIVIGVLSAMPVPAIATTPCLEYGTVNLSGTLVHQTYPGAPDYESVTKGDEPRIIWVLLLDQPTCVVDQSSRYARVYGDREVQVILDADRYKQCQNLLGDRISVAGELVRGGAWHEKRLVLIAREIVRANARSK
jgi:hypothetical protein